MIIEVNIKNNKDVPSIPILILPILDTVCSFRCWNSIVVKSKRIKTKLDQIKKLVPVYNRDNTFISLILTRPDLPNNVIKIVQKKQYVAL